MESEGPSQKLDPAQLRKEAEGKGKCIYECIYVNIHDIRYPVAPLRPIKTANTRVETKLNKKQQQRLARAEARREKRHAKSEARQARKQNVQRAAKWNPEREALDKQKELANRAQKQEKRRRRMHQRAERLRAQAARLMVEAEKAEVRAKLLDEMKTVSPRPPCCLPTASGRASTNLRIEGRRGPEKAVA